MLTRRRLAIRCAFAGLLVLLAFAARGIALKQAFPSRPPLLNGLFFNQYDVPSPEEKAGNAVFNQRLRQLAAESGDEALFATALRRQGFVTSPHAATLELDGFLCPVHVSVAWETHAGRLNRVRGEYASIGCL